MDMAVTAAGHRPGTRPGRVVLAAARSTVYCSLLIPVGIASLLAALLGRHRRVAPRWRALRVRVLGDPAGPVGSPGAVAVAGHALSSVLLGVVALVPLGVELLMLLRGALYGLVDRGPYDHSWGGPTRGGAWVAHFLIGLPVAVVALAAVAGLAALHRRLSAPLDGGRAPRWAVPVTVVAGLAATALFVAWTRQL